MASIATLLGLWAWLLVPETNRVPIERLQATFARHWLWGRFFRRAGNESDCGESGAVLEDARVRNHGRGWARGTGGRGMRWGVGCAWLPISKQP